MATRNQLSVTMPNVAGTLGRMCGALADLKVNIIAFMSEEHAGNSLVRLVVDKPAAGKKALAQIGYVYSEELVLAAALPNRAGTLGEVASRLGEAGVNINYAYAGAESGSRQQLVILSVSDFERGKKLVGR